MSNPISRIVNSLYLKDVGLLEIFFALTPLLMGFQIGPLQLSLLIWPILIFLVFIKYGRLKVKNFWPLTAFVVYWCIHQLALLAICDINTNALLAQMIFFAAFYFLYPSMDAEKVRGAMNWVAIISIIGLLFQWFDVLRGVGVHPIEIPGLSMSESRMETVSFRPSSFYMEPAAYVSFMICPLFLALIDRKYIWTAIIIFSIFLTTSTTGILLSFILLVVSLLSRKIKITSLFVVVVLGIGMVYALSTLEIFEVGIEKLNDTEVSTNIRLSQGPKVVSSMHMEEYLFGVPYGSAYDYCSSGRMTDVYYYGESVFMSTFWDMILSYGIIGLVLYLLIYFKLFRTSRVIWPILVCLCATLFSDPDGIKAAFIYKLIFMLVIANGETRIMNSAGSRTAQIISKHA